MPHPGAPVRPPPGRNSQSDLLAHPQARSALLDDMGPEQGKQGNLVHTAQEGKPVQLAQQPQLAVQADHSKRVHTANLAQVSNKLVDVSPNGL